MSWRRDLAAIALVIVATLIIVGVPMVIVLLMWTSNK